MKKKIEQQWCQLCGGRLSTKPNRVHKCQQPSSSFVKAQPRDMTYSDTWQTRSEVLGERSYQDFLKSPQWKELKKRAKGREHFRRCWICGSTDRIELHHTSYRWINLTDLRNVRPVCRSHHEEIHRYARRKQISVRLATRKIFREFGKRLRGRQAAKIADPISFTHVEVATT